MPREIFIDERIEMRGTAKYTPNMDGHVMEKKRHSVDLFDRIALDTTNRWASYTTGATGATIAISEVQGGSCLLTTGTADEDTCHVAGAIIFTADYEASVEWRVKITDVSGTALFVGFSDAKSEGNGTLPLDYGTAGLDTFRSTASNAVGFVIDADHATSSIMCASCKANSDTTPVDTGIDWADGETKRLRVILDVDGNAIFLIDGDVVARIASAITDSTLLCPIVGAKTQANDGANTIYLYRYDAWQNEA
jgi:hypothetical protein